MRRLGQTHIGLFAWSGFSSISEKSLKDAVADPFSAGNDFLLVLGDAAVFLLLLDLFGVFFALLFV